MIRCHASWVLPIGAPPLRDAWVAIDGDRIVAFGSNAQAGQSADHAREIDLGEVAIVPGLVNAHTHLELSYLRGRVPAGQTFVAWIRAVIASRRDRGPNAPEIVADDAGIAEAIRCGNRGG